MGNSAKGGESWRFLSENLEVLLIVVSKEIGRPATAGFCALHKRTGSLKIKKSDLAAKRMGATDAAPAISQLELLLSKSSNLFYQKSLTKYIVGGCGKEKTPQNYFVISGVKV